MQNESHASDVICSHVTRVRLHACMPNGSAFRSEVLDATAVECPSTTVVRISLTSIHLVSHRELPLVAQFLACTQE